MRFQELAKWFCAAVDAWARGEADWLYEGARNVAVRHWEHARQLGHDADAETVKFLQEQGITLKKKKG